MKLPRPTKPDLSVIACLLVVALKRCTHVECARTAESLAQEIAQVVNAHVDARRIRSVIAEEIEEISKALCPAVLVGQAPYDYWLASNADEIQQREALLWKLECQARKKRKEFIAAVKAAGFGGILPTRKAVAA